jgi:DNA-3-methyladenine glycosylase I
MISKIRCEWAESDLSRIYHDKEWGVPLHDERRLFEFVVLEGAQAGLSWETILLKRAAYREAFEGFDPQQVAFYGPEETARLLANPGIVRNRLKIASAIRNAQAFLRVQEEFGSFDSYWWRFVDGKPIQNAFTRMSELPVKTQLAERISNDLLARGFNFVGPTIVYALMQAVGMVNDHIVTCFRYGEVGKFS